MFEPIVEVQSARDLKKKKKMPFQLDLKGWIELICSPWEFTEAFWAGCGTTNCILASKKLGNWRGKASQ